MQDLHSIHAAGVLTDAGVVLLAGASGVGKSTLAVALAMSPRAQLLSDSFVLHNGLDILPVREPVLLDAWSHHWLGERADELQPLSWRYALRRCGYQLPPQRLSAGGRAALLLFPRRSHEPYVRRIASEQAHQRLSAADLIINDLRRYWAYAAIVEQMVPAGLMARREARIARLVAGVPCYELGITPDTTSGAVRNDYGVACRWAPAGGRQTPVNSGDDSGAVCRSIQWRRRRRLADWAVPFDSWLGPCAFRCSDGALPAENDRG